MTARSIPNALTLFRLLACPVFLILASSSSRMLRTAAWVLLVVALFTDVFDGILARRYGWVSKIGVYLDPAVDKIVLLSGFFQVMTWGWLPLWVPLALMARELVVNAMRSGAAIEGRLVPANWMGYSDLTVVDGQYYTYYVVAYKGATESAHSNEATVEAGPPYVTILTPSSGEVLNVGDMYDITWVTNLPDFDARIFLATDGGIEFPPEHLVQFSWAPNGSPYPWKVGYINTEDDSSNPPVWEQVIFSTNTQCKIFIRHYSAVGAQNWSEMFTINVP